MQHPKTLIEFLWEFPITLFVNSHFISSSATQFATSTILHPSISLSLYQLFVGLTLSFWVAHRADVSFTQGVVDEALEFFLLIR